MRRHRVGRNLIPLIEGLEDSEDYKKYRKLIKQLHSITKCSFVDGKCPSLRLSGWHQCCCGCAESSGYLKFFPKEQKHYLKLYDKEKGFVGDKGCVLPVKFRSLTCVGYYCGDQQKEMKYRYGSKYDSMIRKMDKLRDKAYDYQNKIGYI